MLQQALDFQAESDQLLALVEQFTEQDWERQTQFKHWTTNDIIAHLHLFNYAADAALRDPEEFANLMREMAAAIKRGNTHLAFTHAKLDGAKNRDLMNKWRDFYRAMAGRFSAADP